MTGGISGKNKAMLDEWAQMVSKCRSSGQTVEKWCGENGINIKTYYYRMKRVSDSRREEIRLCGAEPRDIVAVNFNETIRKPSGIASLRMSINGVEISVYESTDDETLRRVIRVLKSV